MTRNRSSSCLRPLLGTFLLSVASLAHGSSSLEPLGQAGDSKLAPHTALNDSIRALPITGERQITFDTNQGTWLSPDLSPDGRRIVFELLGDLYLLPAHGGQAQAITRGIAFDSQPVFSPDGQHIAFISDRSGAENLWLINADSGALRQVTFLDGDPLLVSPAWSADGKALFVSRLRTEFNAYELWQFDVSTGDGELVVTIRTSPDQTIDSWRSTLGAAPSADGRYLYYATHTGPRSFDVTPEWMIRRRDLRTGSEETLISAPRSPRPDLVLGTAMRPAISPDGRWLVYGARHQAHTGLRVLDLQTQTDRWLVFPVQRDQLGATHLRDLLPRHPFTPDGTALIINTDGRLQRIELADGRRTDIPFSARVELSLGPLTRQSIPLETGPVHARVIQTPEPSPDGSQLAFSALGRLYLVPLDGTATPRHLDTGNQPAFHPSWSPDGTSLVYVTWTASDGGHVWRITPDAPDARPVRVSSLPAFYTRPVFSPDSGEIIALRSSNSVRMHSYMEYGALRKAELIALPADGGAARIVAKGTMGGKPHFATSPEHVYLNFSDGLNRVALDGGGRVAVLRVTGPGWYFAPGRADVDDLRLSPDGRWVLAQIAQQLHLLEMPDSEGQTLDLAEPGVAHHKLTSVGADFLGWSADGRTLHWSVGSTWHRHELSRITSASGRTSPIDAKAGAGHTGTEAFPVSVAVPRDTPHGALLLRGATVLTMHNDAVVDNADLLIINDRIAALGPRGSVELPEQTVIRDVSGHYVLPGLIDAHNHLADIRRDVLDFASWGPLANLAYGVTSVFDPSTLSIDTLAYQDLVEAGLMTGSRIFSTGPAIFSFNEFSSYADVHSALSRYRDHYRLGNIKMYRSGNRQVRQWIAMAANALSLMPTTEGALSMKLDLTHVLDGYAGNEHALTAVPLKHDVVQLLARSGTNYNATLMITNGGPEGQDDFISRKNPGDDPKLHRFTPGFIVDMKTRIRTWRTADEYLYPRVAAGVAEVMRAGGRVGMGSHGEMPGIGMHWELEAHVMGGMSPYEALQAGTIGSAAAIGREKELGSIEPGKYADLLVLDKDPRENIAHTLSLRLIMKNGRLHDGDTLTELWPRRRTLPEPWYRGDQPRDTSTPDTLSMEKRQ